MEQAGLELHPEKTRKVDMREEGAHIDYIPPCVGLCGEASPNMPALRAVAVSATGSNGADEAS